MSSLPATRVVYSIVFFVLMMLLIIVSRPSWIFDPETGAPRPFGFSDDSDASKRRSTLFSFGVVVVLASVLSLYTFSWIDLVWGGARASDATMASSSAPTSLAPYASPPYASSPSYMYDVTSQPTPVFMQDHMGTYHHQPPTIVPVRIY